MEVKASDTGRKCKFGKAIPKGKAEEGPVCDNHPNKG